MKKLLSLLMVEILVITLWLAATPIGAKNKTIFYDSLLADGPTPDVLNYGRVTIDNEFVVNIELQTDQPDKTYHVRMEQGPAGPLGTLLRRGVSLGTITTDTHGKGKAEFILESPPPRVSGPHFVIYSSSPTPDFDTSYGPVPPVPPTMGLSGRVVLNMQTLPASGASFSFSLSYGSYCGYPNGLVMQDNQQVDSGYNVPPGVYTINETLLSGWLNPNISIVDPSGGTISSGTQTTINLASGETVTITYINIQPAITPPPPTTTAPPPTTTPPPALRGRIILNKVTVPSSAAGFNFALSYAQYFNYSNAPVHDGDSVDSGFTVPPGAYTIREIVPEITPDPIIIINDPSRDSFSQGSQTMVGLAAGETVMVTYFNPGILPSSSPILADQKNESNAGTSWGGSPDFMYQSFTPTSANLTAVDLLVRPGGYFPIRGTTSLVMIREGSPTGTAMGLATARVNTPENLGQQVWIRFWFASPIALVPGNTYVISWYMPGAPMMTWMGSTGNPYSGGSAFYSAGSPVPDVDFNFVTYHASTP